MPDLSLSGKLPTGDRNGLSALLPSLIDAPTTVRPAIVLLDVSRITEDTGTGDRVPQVRIRTIEPILGDDAAYIDRLLRRAAERRTGKVELPLDLEVEIDALGEAVHGAVASPLLSMQEIAEVVGQVLDDLDVVARNPVQGMAMHRVIALRLAEELPGIVSSEPDEDPDGPADESKGPDEPE